MRQSAGWREVKGEEVEDEVKERSIKAEIM